MKKTLLTLTAVMVAAGAFAQGTVQFNNSTAGALTKIYMPDGYSSYGAASSTVAGKTGNTATDSVAGTQTYTGALLQGAFTAELWSLNGGGQLESALAFSGATTTFRTGTGAGRLAVATATLANVPKDSAQATLQIRVYPTSFGSWTQAKAAFDLQNPLAWIGSSIVFNINLVGGDVNTPPAMTGLTSFSLATPIVPEPSSMAIAGLGAASLLIFRRRK